MTSAVPPERESWKCSRCRKINKYSANNCPKCGRYWQSVIDHSFVDPRNRSESPRGRRPTYAQDWEYEEPWDQQWGRQPRDYTNSPRYQDQTPAPRRSDGWGQGRGQPQPKGHGKDKGKDQVSGKGKGFSHLPEQVGPQFSAPPQMSAPSSWMQLMPQQSVTLAPPPPPPAAPEMDPVKMRELLKLLEKRQDTLDPEIQTAVQEVKVVEAQTETAQLLSAVEYHGKAKQELAAAHQARGQIHSSWVAFLNASVQQWKEFAEQFAKQESTALERIQAAQEAYMRACDRLNQEKASAGVPVSAATKL
eukprot:s36_g9.t1